MSETGPAPEARPAILVIRDIPRNCLCVWRMRPGEDRFRLTVPNRCCPWHISREQEGGAGA